jgi:hypothetical protein
MSCPYKHALGTPEQGVHATRFLGLAWNDTLTVKNIKLKPVPKNLIDLLSDKYVLPSK